MLVVVGQVRVARELPDGDVPTATFMTPLRAVHVKPSTVSHVIVPPVPAADPGAYVVTGMRGTLSSDSDGV
jgi:hypothetical protein